MTIHRRERIVLLLQIAKMYFVLVVLMSIASQGTTEKLVGFDCGTHLTNLTTLSLLDVEECNIAPPELNITEKPIQLLQVAEFTSIHVIQCSLKITRTITHCGMHHHSSRVQDGEIAYFKEVQRDECMRLYDGGFINVAGTILNNVPKNSTFSTALVFAGTVDKHGSCVGSSYSDPYGKWNNVLVQGFVEILLIDYYASVNLDTNSVQLRSGVTCKLTESHCRDIIEGYAFWEPLPSDTCGSLKYSVLYEGSANKTIESKTKTATYMLESESIIFALTSIGETNVCGYRLIRTEHPKLYILEDFGEKIFKSKENIAIQNLDIFAYVNSKFVYVEKHFRSQIKQMYHDLLKHKCELERQVIINALSIATQSPDEFAYRLTKEPGFMGVVAGEVVHLVKCLQVEVKRRNTKGCYNQLPVYMGGEEMFLSPRTRILIRTGAQIACSSSMPPMFFMGEYWLQFLPDGSHVPPPKVLKPQTKSTWEYLNSKSLATAGIYTDSDLKKLRDHIMFPVEKSSVLNDVALGMSGRSIDGRGISINQFLDKELLESLANSAWERMWSKFLTFGTASAGIIGILMLARLIKLIIDTIIHGYAIYSIYGWSLHLLGAIWNSVTQLLLHLGKNPDKSNQQNSENDPKTPDKKDKGVPSKKKPTSEAIYDDVEKNSVENPEEFEVYGHINKAHRSV